jgi:heme/copper-type cytochrome/quinol oxidase subunit 1
VSPVDALWHLLNFLAPAAFLGLVMPLLAKMLWRRDLAAVPMWRLGLWSCAVGVLTLVGGLIVYGSDGKVITYAAMVVAEAITLWAVGFRFGGR